MTGFVLLIYSAVRAPALSLERGNRRIPEAE